MNLETFILAIGFVLFFLLVRWLSKRWIEGGMSYFLYYTLVIALSIIGYWAILMFIAVKILQISC